MIFKAVKYFEKGFHAHHPGITPVDFTYGMGKKQRPACF